MLRRTVRWQARAEAQRKGPVRAQAQATLGVLVLACSVLTGCTAGSGASGANYVSGDGTVTLVPVAQRRPPVTFAGVTLAGEPLDVLTYRGKTVVINVWGSWCPPCRKESPELQATADALKSKNVAFIGIDAREDPATGLAFQRTHGITYPSLADVDQGSGVLLALNGALSLKSLPVTLVLDPQGRIAARIGGATTKATLTAVVEDVATGKSTL